MSEAREDPAEASAAPAGSRAAPEQHDDDELAAALQAQLERFAPSGSIPVISPEEAAEARAASAASPAPTTVPTAQPSTAGAVPVPSSAQTGPVDGDGRRPGWPTFARADEASAGPARDATSTPAPAPMPPVPGGPVRTSYRPTEPPPVRPSFPTGAFPTGSIPAGSLPPSPASPPSASPAPATGPPVRAPSGGADPAPAAEESRFPSPVPHFAPPADPPTVPASESLLPREDGPHDTEETPPVSDAPDFVDAAAPPTHPLEILEQIQPRLDGLKLDPETFREWQESLLAIAHQAPPPATPPPARIAPPTDASAAVPDVPRDVVSEVPGDGVAEAEPTLAGRSAPGNGSAQHVVPESNIDDVRDIVPAPNIADVPGLAFAPDLASAGFGLPPLPFAPVGATGSPTSVPDDEVEVVHAELIDEDADDEDVPAQPEPWSAADTSTGAVQLHTGPVSATGSAALAFRSRSAIPGVEAGDSQEVEPLALDSITTDTGSIPTGSLPILTTTLDRDLHDDVDDVVAPQELLADPGAAPLAALSTDTGSVEPVASASVRTGAITLPVPEAAPPTHFALEAADLRPTEEDQRLRRPIAQFWLWLAPNSSALTLALGTTLVAFGVSFRQGLIAAVLGVVVACLTLAVDVLAVKRTGQPVAVVSRAAFGIRGNVLPTAILLLVRLFWASVLTWLAAGTVRSVVTAAGWDSVVSGETSGVIVAVVFPIVAALVAVFGHGLLARVHLVLGGLSVLLLILLLVLTAPMIDMTQVLATPDGSPLRLVAAAVAVLSLLAVAWASAGGELARYQNPVSSGTGTAAWASLGAALPAFVLTLWGLLLAGSAAPESARALSTDPIAALVGRLPSWYPVPLLFAVVLGLLAALATVLYSGGLTLGATGVRLSRPLRTVLLAAVAIAAGIGLLVASPPMTALLRDLVPVLAVPVVAWTGILAGEFFQRTRPFDSEALLRRGGRYPDARWVSLAALVVISVLGIGLVGGSGFSRAAGYVWLLFGVPPGSPLAQADLGVPLALLLGLVTPFAFGRQEIRRQEERVHPVATLEE